MVEVRGGQKIGTRDDFQRARDELLKREKEHTRLGDELARQRRELPWAGSQRWEVTSTSITASQSEEASALVQAIGDSPVADIAVDCGTELAGYLTEAPALSAFALEDGIVYFTYSTFARGTEC